MEILSFIKISLGKKNYTNELHYLRLASLFFPYYPTDTKIKKKKLNTPEEQTKKLYERPLM